MAGIKEISRGAGRARCGGQRRRPGGAPGGICGRDGNRDTRVTRLVEAGQRSAGEQSALGLSCVLEWTEGPQVRLNGS